MGDNLDDECDFVNVPAETPLSPEEAITRRHRREKKELQGKIQSMKKNVSKSDKKKKKELADEIAKLEAELEERHRVELDTFRPKRIELPEDKLPPTAEETQSECGDETKSETPGTPKMSKARRRREKKEAEEREKRRLIDVETEELTENSVRTQEERLLEEILKDLKLEVIDIPSDGHWFV
ncbi:unnamed protein product [Orchesella dallaii]|uniref:Uncharacterized protein n=1 Tax=Orchesella dallaii TaxID=48710 RepID=A0ABP1QGA4_9HEXA